MKNVRFLLCLSVFLFSMSLSSAVLAKDEAERIRADVSLRLHPLKNEKKMLFCLSELGGRKAVLEVKDARNHLVYSRVWKKSEVPAQIFNFGALPEGVYQILVSVGDVMLKKQILVDRQQVLVLKSAHLSDMPEVNVAGKLVSFSWTGGRTDCRVTFFNENGETVYSDRDFKQAKENGGFIKNYNFSKMENGLYSYVVNLGSRKSKGTFRIE